MVKLSDITYIGITTRDLAKTMQALKKSLERIVPEKVVIISSEYPADLANVCKNVPFEWFHVLPFPSMQEYSGFHIHELHKYFTTTHCLTFHWDGYIYDEDKWDESWKQFDFIGASWVYPDGINNGNGAFSLRSLKLCKLVADIIPENFPEDELIGRTYRKRLEKMGVKFAPEDVCDIFSFEQKQPVQSTFGFHGFLHEKYDMHRC